MNRLVHESASIVLLHRWDPVLAASLIERDRATVANMVPVMVGDLLSAPGAQAYDFSSIRSFSGGGAAMPTTLSAKLHDRCGVTFLQGYGLTEVGCQSHVNPPQRVKTASVGIPIQSMESIVVASDTPGASASQ